jgi:hypothetical protein
MSIGLCPVADYDVQGRYARRGGIAQSTEAPSCPLGVLAHAAEAANTYYYIPDRYNLNVPAGGDGAIMLEGLQGMSEQQFTHRVICELLQNVMDHVADKNVRVSSEASDVLTLSDAVSGQALVGIHVTATRVTIRQYDIMLPSATVLFPIGRSTKTSSLAGGFGMGLKQVMQGIVCRGHPYAYRMIGCTPHNLSVCYTPAQEANTVCVMASRVSDPPDGALTQELDLPSVAPDGSVYMHMVKSAHVLLYFAGNVPPSPFPQTSNVALLDLHSSDCAADHAHSVPVWVNGILCVTVPVDPAAVEHGDPAAANLPQPSSPRMILDVSSSAQPMPLGVSITIQNPRDVLPYTRDVDGLDRFFQFIAPAVRHIVDTASADVRLQLARALLVPSHFWILLQCDDSFGTKQAMASALRDVLLPLIEASGSNVHIADDVLNDPNVLQVYSRHLRAVHGWLAVTMSDDAFQSTGLGLPRHRASVHTLSSFLLHRNFSTVRLPSCLPELHDMRERCSKYLKQSGLQGRVRVPNVVLWHCSFRKLEIHSMPYLHITNSTMKIDEVNSWPSLYEGQVMISVPDMQELLSSQHDTPGNVAHNVYEDFVRFLFLQLFVPLRRVPFSATQWASNLAGYLLLLGPFAQWPPKADNVILRYFKQLAAMLDETTMPQWEGYDVTVSRAAASRESRRSAPRDDGASAKRPRME